jgi:hypothetical protein
MGCKNPLVEWDFGALKYASHRDRKLLPAGVALVQTPAMRLAVKGDGMFEPAMRADRTVGPDLGFEVRAGPVLVLVDRAGDVQLYGNTPSRVPRDATRGLLSNMLCQVNIAKTLT